MPITVRKATLEDVARAARVHRSTASLSLRDHPRIPPATRERVKAAATALGYRIDPLVSALMQTRRSPRAAGPHRLAFLTWSAPQAPDSPTADRFGGAAARARDFGFELEPVVCDGSESDGRALSDRLSVRCINGVIVDRFPAAVPVPDLDWNRFSCVAIGRSATAPALHRVVENDFDAMRQAMQCCRRRGYRRVGLVLGVPFDSPHSLDPLLGAYANEQLRFAPDEWLWRCPGAPARPDSFVPWFSLRRPDALLVDDPAPVRSWLARLGLRSPRDVALVTLRPTRAAECSGVYCEPARLGALGIEMLLGLMHRREKGLPAAPHETLLTPDWHDNGSLPFFAPPSPASISRRGVGRVARAPVDNARVGVP